MAIGSFARRFILARSRNVVKTSRTSRQRNASINERARVSIPNCAAGVRLLDLLERVDAEEVNRVNDSSVPSQGAQLAVEVPDQLSLTAR